MNRSECKVLRKELTKAMDQIGKNFSMDIEIGSIAFGHNSFRVKLSGLKHGAKTREERDYEANAYNRWPKLGESISLNGEDFEITGWNRKAPKYPIQLRRNGSNFKISIAMLTASLRGNFGEND